MRVEIERRLERLTQLAGGAVLEERETLVELGDVLQLLGPAGYDRAEVTADESFDRRVARGPFELDSEDGVGVPNVELIANLRDDIDADVLRWPHPLGLRLDG